MKFRKVIIIIEMGILYVKWHNQEFSKLLNFEL